MKKIMSFVIAALIFLSAVNVCAFEDIPVKFLVNGSVVSFSFTPVIRDGVTYVDAKTLCTKLGLSYKTYPDHESVVISNSRNSICLVPGEPYATVSDLTGISDREYTYKFLTAPCIYIDSHLAVAARDIASVFSYALSFDAQSGTVYFGYSPAMLSDSTHALAQSSAYYFQNQSEFALPSFGSGYCWACSYAMLITNVTGTRVTPSDVAAVNLTKSASGAYCYHSEIVSAFGVSFANALSPLSPYYGGRADTSGGTYINNPEKDDTVTIAALREALTLHPEGVMLRYEGYPHTMLAVAFEGDIVLFNDPAPSTSYSYSDEGKYRGVPFSETCVAKKGFSLSDVTFIQALD